MEIVKDMETVILSKCGWNEKQQDFFGMMVHNIGSANNASLADVVCRRDEKEISVEWFVPNKEGDRVSMVYDRNTKSLVTSKTDEGIKSSKDMEVFLDTIENTVGSNKGMFFPTNKVEIKNTIKPNV